MREALAAGQLQRVAGYLGRHYRLVAVAGPGGAALQPPDSLWCAPRSWRTGEDLMEKAQVAGPGVRFVIARQAGVQRRSGDRWACLRGERDARRAASRRRPEGRNAVRRLPTDALRNQAPLAGAYLADAFFERLPDPPAPPPEAPPAPPLQAPPAGCGGEVGAAHAWPGADQGAGAGPGAPSDPGSGGRAAHGRGGPAQDPAPGSLPAAPQEVAGWQRVQVDVEEGGLRLRLLGGAALPERLLAGRCRVSIELESRSVWLP